VAILSTPLGIRSELVRRSCSPSSSVCREGMRIYRCTRPPQSTKIVYNNESFVRVHGTKCWERWTVCISYNEMISIYSPVSPNAPATPLSISHLLSVIVALLSSFHQLRAAKSNGSEGEKSSILPQWPRRVYIISCNLGMNVAN